MKRIILFNVIAAISFVKVYATDVGGIISVNTIWTAANSPYIVKSNLLLEAGAELIIEPGVEVKFDQGVGCWIYGTLKAQGSESRKILFTSSNISPQKGDWMGFRYESENSYIANINGEYISGSILSNCIYEYFEYIYIINSSVYLENSIFRYGKSSVGYRHFANTNCIIRNCEFTDFTRVGFSFINVGFASLINCTFKNNATLDLYQNVFGLSELLNIDSCNFVQNQLGLNCHINGNKSINVINCNFYENITGIDISYSDNPMPLKIYNSHIYNNDIGIQVYSMSSENCEIANCSLYENHSYQIKSSVSNKQFNINAINNWWGTTNEQEIVESLYDFYDNFNLNKIIFKPYLLGPVSTYSLTINATNGSVTKSPDQATYNSGSSVILTATPSPGYSFTGWSGDATGSTNPLTVTMDANKTITANFQIIQYTVSTSSNPANGGTTSGAGMYNAGQSATVTATPALNFHFVNWTENGSQISSNSSYSFTVNSNRTLVANFAIDSNLPPYVVPYVSNRQTPPLLANNEWYIDIEVGDIILPVTNLYAVSATLDFSASHGLIEVVGESAGSFLGEDLLFFATRDNVFDSLKIMVSRSGSQDGVNGFGAIARVKFRNKTNIPSANSIFMVTKNIKGFDPLGGDVPLRGSSFVVPVELSSFTATVAGKNVYLNWRTESETNNYGFEIERTINGNAGWVKIGFVSGNGTSSQPNDYCYTDTELQPGQVSYRLKQIDNDGTYTYSKIVAVNGEEIPMGFTLFQNSPNPFNPVTSITYYLSQESRIKLRVFDLQGREIEILVDGVENAGQHTVSWDAKGLPSGIYLYCLESGSYREMKRALLLK